MRAGAVLRAVGTPQVDRVVVATTDLGSVYAALSAAAVLAAAGRTRLAADIAGLGVSGWLLAQAAKGLVGRARPYEAEGARRLVRPPSGSSFPSGHATLATAVGIRLAAASTGPARVLFAALGPSVATSRVYAGVHYPSDVLAGVGLGLTLAALWATPVGTVLAGTVGALSRVTLGGVRYMSGRLRPASD